MTQEEFDRLTASHVKLMTDHEVFVHEHDKRVAEQDREWERQAERWRRYDEARERDRKEQKARDEAIDKRIADLVSGIGALVGKILP